MKQYETSLSGSNKTSNRTIERTYDLFQVPVDGGATAVEPSYLYRFPGTHLSHQAHAFLTGSASASSIHIYAHADVPTEDSHVSVLPVHAIT